MNSKCPDCGVSPGELHVPGCSMERCPRCNGQAIGCDCIYYEFCGIDTDTMEETHPGIYKNGPTDEMYERWDKEWGSKRKPYEEKNEGTG